MELISFENLTPEERAMAKNKEAASRAKTVYENAAKTEAREEIARGLIQKGFDNQFIAELTHLTIAQIEALRLQ